MAKPTSAAEAAGWLLTLTARLKSRPYEASVKPTLDREVMKGAYRAADAVAAGAEVATVDVESIVGRVDLAVDCDLGVSGGGERRSKAECEAEGRKSLHTKGGGPREGTTPAFRSR